MKKKNKSLLKAWLKLWYGNTFSFGEVLIFLTLGVGIGLGMLREVFLLVIGLVVLLAGKNFRSDL